MSNPSDDPRVRAARDILAEGKTLDLSDHAAVVQRVGALEAAVAMLLRAVEDRP